MAQFATQSRERAAELLIAAAAHRISVEHWLARKAVEKQQIEQAILADLNEAHFRSGDDRGVDDCGGCGGGSQLAHESCLRGPRPCSLRCCRV